MHERYLEHYGVPGMKWGRRKSNGQILIGGPTNQGTNSSSGYSKQSSSGGSGTGSKKKSKPYVDAKWREVPNDGPSNKSSSSTPPKSKPKSETPPPSKSKTNEFDVSKTQTGIKSGKKVAEAGANMLAKDRKDRHTKSLKAEAKEMSDEDLKKVINRLATEQRYVELMGKEGVKEAKSNLETTLETLGTVASIADTALGVYGAIQDVRRMK